VPEGGLGGQGVARSRSSVGGPTTTA